MVHAMQQFRQRASLPWRLWIAVGLCWSVIAISVPSNAAEKATAEARTAESKANHRRGLELFEKKIRPALIEHCYECHASDSDDIGGNLLVDSRSGLLAGGDAGPAISPGKPGESLLLKAITYDGLEMPPDEKLPDSVAADFRRWIALGAPDPRRADPATTQPSESDAASPLSPVESLWSVQPIRDVTVPATDSAWPRTEIDHFIHAQHVANEIVPNPDASPAVLLRRLYFDLIGLPPTPEQVNQYTNDPSAQNYARIVDTLLDSRAFGERWARHWLDVARYGESAGSSRDVLMLYAWRYRDYVIDAFCDDIPFDRFIIEQIAGDLLPADSDEQRRRLQTATGLLAIGSKSLNGGNLTYDVIDDQIDVISKSVLGLTVSCARCHDHKFDPIPTADYYSLAGIFLSTDTRYGGSINRPTDAKTRAEVYLLLGQELDPKSDADRIAFEKEFAAISKQVQSSKKRVASLRDSVPEAYRADVTLAIPEEWEPPAQLALRQYQGAVRVLGERELKLAETTKHLESFAKPDYALGVQDAKQIADAKILLRGEKNQPGVLAPRGFLSAVAFHDDADLSAALSIDGSQSGRLQLAQWLTNPGNPLTPRVAANRIWQHLMGQGIVETVDNFGASGLPPSDPDLLDHLALRFRDQHQWSTKQLIREIVLSRTYQLASHPNPAAYAKDPDNRLRWRMDRRRLDAEPLRDAILSVSGLLQEEPLQGSLVMQIGEGEVGRNINTTILEQPFDHRSIYLPIIRGIIPEELKLFDFPEPSNVQGRRDSNTTATQSLYFMNSALVIRAARSFATRLIDDATLATDTDRIRSAYLQCFGKTADEAQVQRSLEFISRLASDTQTTDADQEIWTAYCQALIASAPFRFID